MFLYTMVWFEGFKGAYEEKSEMQFVNVGDNNVHSKNVLSLRRCDRGREKEEGRIYKKK
jgi:hypothetical protein